MHCVRVFQALSACILVTLSGPAACVAEATGGWATDVARLSPEFTYEAFAGADTSAPGWAAYGGLTAALFGDIRENGWRLRSTASYGQYRYSRTYWDGTTKQVVRLELLGHRRTTDLLIGYQHSHGPVVVKAYAGLVEDWKLDVAEEGSPIAVDDENGYQGRRYGAKLALETWTRLADWGFVQADTSWSEPRNSHASRLRLGYRVGTNWSTGLEAAAYGNLVPEQGRAGAFVRLEWDTGEVSLSAGAGLDRQRVDDGYGTLNAMLRF